MIYTLHSMDPNGEFVEVRWETPAIPRIGERVMLPEDPAGGQWQELSVLEISHFPGDPEVWVAEGEAPPGWVEGTIRNGWEPGSIAGLFTNAESYREAHS